MVKDSYDVCAVEGGLGAHAFSMCFKRGDEMVEDELLKRMSNGLCNSTLYLMSECPVSTKIVSRETIVSSSDLLGFAQHIAKRGVFDGELAVAFFFYAVGDRLVTLSPHTDDIEELVKWARLELPTIHSPRSEGRLSPREKRARDATYLYLVGRYVDGELNAYLPFDTTEGVRASLNYFLEFRNA